MEGCGDFLGDAPVTFFQSVALLRHRRLQCFLARLRPPLHAPAKRILFVRMGV